MPPTVVDIDHRNQAPLHVEPNTTPLASFLGWLCLILAALLFAVVHLAPRLMTSIRLEQEYETNHLRLVSLEHQLKELEGFAAALESDPEFTAAVARVEFPTHHPDEQRIIVEPHLAQEPRAAAPNLRVTPAPWPWYTPFVRAVIEDQRLNTGMLFGSAMLVMLAFVPLEGKIVRVIGGRTIHQTTGLLSYLRDRYTKK